MRGKIVSISQHEKRRAKKKDHLKTLFRDENDNAAFPSQTWASFLQMYPIEKETAEIRHTASSLCECTIHRRKEFVNHTMRSWLIIIDMR